MDADTISFVAAALIGALIVAAFWFGRKQRPATVTDAAADIQRAMQTAQDLVAAAEQLWASGQMPADNRFDYVLMHLRYLFPGLRDEQLKAVIEAGVYFLKQGVIRLDGPVNEREQP